MYMFEEDHTNMAGWTLEYPDDETGGDIFGLWSSSNGLNPVIHVILGPGRGCRRSGASFFQSIPYLNEVGKLLTGNLMLCHIGEWHSHHRLGLREPSSGDCRTVWSNIPQGIYGFLLIIANLGPLNRVSLSPYLFTELARNGKTNRKCIPCALKYLRGRSPFREIDSLARKIDRGAERHKLNAFESRLLRREPVRKTAHSSSVSAVDKFVAARPTPHRLPVESWNKLGPSSQSTSTDYPRVRSRVLTSDYVSTNVPAAVKRNQWYSSSHGERELRQMVQRLHKLPYSENVQMCRDAVSHDLTMSVDLRRTRKRCILKFPNDYPLSPVVVLFYPLCIDTEMSSQTPVDTKRTRATTFIGAREEIVRLLSSASYSTKR